MDPITLAALISGGATILGGLFGSSAADKAAKTQASSADKALELQKATLAQSRLDAAPWLDAGRKALDAYKGELGLTPGYQSQFEKSPSYDFEVKEGEKGVLNSLGAMGMKNSGAALKKLTEFRTGLARGEYGNYLSRLGGMANVGQNTMQGNNAAALASAGQQGQLMTDAGTARASGYTGAANSWINGASSFANNMGNWLGSYDQNWQKVAA